MGQAASYAGDDEQQAAADCFEHEEGEYSKPGDLASATLRVDRIELLLTQASSHRCFLKKLSKEEKKQYIMLRCCCGWESSKYKERTREATMRVTQDHQNHTREVKERQCDWNAAKRLLKLLKEATTLIGDSGHADVGVAKREFLARAMAGEAKHLWKRRTGSADAGSPLLIAVAKGCLHFMMAYATLSSKERAAMERIVMLSHRTGRVPPLTAAHSAVMRDVAEPLPATQAAQDVSLATLQESGCEALQVCEGYAAEAYEGVSEGSSDSDEDETDVADDELSSLEELGKRSDPDVHRKYAADAPLRAAVDSLASFGNYEHAKLPNRGAKKRRLEEAASAPGQERLVTSAPPISDRAPPQKRKKARPAAPLPQPARATVDAAHAMHSPSPAEAIGCVESTE